MGLKIGITGVGGFGAHFVKLFKAHPLVDEVVIAEVRAERRTEVARAESTERVFASHDEMCASDVDAIAIFTQRWRHAPMAIQALRAGKHVYSAVPAAVTLEELDELVKTVEETNLVYNLGETSYYRPQTIYCRRRFAHGDFGRFIYGEGQYYHDMSHWFYPPFYEANGPEWKRYASVPPMWYPTHSVSHVLSVTFSRMTKVSCFGFVDEHPDGIFDKELSAFDNDFSNQSALFRTADGGMARINEFRRTAAGESRMSILGTLGAYEEQASAFDREVMVQEQIEGKESGKTQSVAVWSEIRTVRDPFVNGEYDYEHTPECLKKHKEDVTPIHVLNGVEISEENLGNLPREYLGKRHLGVSCLHEVERLPKEFVGLPNGHCGSHQFLVQDFLEAIERDMLPPNHVWLSARYNAPGIVAHESSRREGELMTIPDFGHPPRGAKCLDSLVELRD